MIARDAKDALVLEVCRRFLGTDQNPQEIADAINHEWDLKDLLTREQIYPLFREARRRDFIMLLPQLDRSARDEVARRYDLSADTLHVVPARGKGALEIVANAAADRVLNLIREIGSRKRVHIGLGAGGTMTQFSQKLALRLRTEPGLPKLAFHALSTGCNVARPYTAPVSFFSAFHEVADVIEYFGLFAPAFIPTGSYRRETRRRGVIESFERAGDIDIVVSAIAWAGDPHAELNHYIESKEERERMQRAGHVGDVLYRPFSTTGPLRHKPSIKAVSLFELPELVDLAKTPGKHVLLIAGPCAFCDLRKGRALRPLLACPELRVWSEIVMDLPTTEELLSAQLA